MGIQKVGITPGKPAVATYWPFKVNSAGGDWVYVNPGEVFYDPLIGGEILDIKGFNVPFKVNDKSFIYLQVFFDMCGRPTHAGIAHTGRNLQWLMPGERWLGYPRLYAVDKIPYFGMWRDETIGQYYHHVGSGRPDAWVQATEGWFAANRPVAEGAGGEGGAAVGYPGNANVVGGVHWLQNVAPKDTEITCNVTGGAGLYASNQIYTGIDRELRKDICAQGVNVNNPFHQKYPWNLKDVGWMAERGINPGLYTHRRQMLAYLDGFGNLIPGQRGILEFGGYMNPAKNPYPQGISQETSYRDAYSKILRGCFALCTKLWRTNIDQVMAFYPIAYAAKPTRKLADGFVGGGVKVTVTDQKDFQDNPVPNTKFQIVQACKTNLRLATIIEGDNKFKAIMPYQGMHTQMDTGPGWSTTNYLNFDQRWEYHVDAGVPGVNGAISGGADYQPGGKKYYRRVTGRDLPFSQDYLDALFNNQRRQI